MRNFACLSLALTTFIAGVVACSSETASGGGSSGDNEPGVKDAGFDSAPQADSGTGVLGFLPEQSFSGYDGTHTFKAPVAVYDAADDLEVTGDPSAVDITPVKLKTVISPDGIEDKGQYFMVTVKKAGEHKIVAQSRGRRAEVVLTANEYPPSQWAEGEARYTTAGTSGEPPCTQCHVNGEAIDHSPASLSSATDEEVGAVITSGRSTANTPIQIDGKPGHKWQVTEDERKALVTYLRGLEPRGFVGAQ